MNKVQRLIQVRETHGMTVVYHMTRNVEIAPMPVELFRGTVQISICLKTNREMTRKESAVDGISNLLSPLSHQSAGNLVIWAPK